MKQKLYLINFTCLITIVCLNLSVLAWAQGTGSSGSAIQAEENIPEDIYDDSLARLPQIKRSNLDAQGRAAFDTYVSPGTGYETGLRGPVGMWMHSPSLASAVFDVRQRVRYGTPKDQRLTELIILSTAREVDNQYEWSAHEPLAQIAGLEQEIIEAIKHRKNLASLSEISSLGEVERVLIQFTRELVSEDKVSSGTFKSAINLFGNEGLVDIVGLVGYYNFVAMTLKAFDVQRPVGTLLLLPTLSN